MYTKKTKKRGREQVTKKSDMKQRDKAWANFHDAFKYLLDNVDGFIAVEDSIITSDELNQIAVRVRKLGETVERIAAKYN